MIDSTTTSGEPLLSEPVAAADLRPGDRIRALDTDAGGRVWTVRLVEPVHDSPVWTHAVVCDESPYRRYLAHTGTEFVLATPNRVREEQINRAAEFLPQRAPGELPALRVGDAVVTAYWRDDGLRVAVDTSDVEDPRGDCPVEIVVENATVYRRPLEVNASHRCFAGQPAPPVDPTVLDLFRRIKSLERPDGSWPGAEIVPLLCAWFADRGIYPDGQEG